MNTGTALGLDLLVVSVSLALLLRLYRGEILHPFRIVLCCHFYVVTSRLIQLAFGMDPMWVDVFTWRITREEVLRAAMAADLGLVAMLTVWVIQARGRRLDPHRFHPLSSRALNIVAPLCLTVGMGAIFTFGRQVEGQNLNMGDWETSGYLRSLLVWPAWATCLWVYRNGLRPFWIAVSACALLAVGYGNWSRYGIICPLVFFAFTWLSQNKIRRLPVRALLGAVIVVGLWFPMKPAFGALANGQGPNEAIKIAWQYLQEELSRPDLSVDTQFLDMTASTMTLTDVHGEWFYGRTLVPIFVGPIPRQFWPEKPRIDLLLQEVSTVQRPMARIQMVPGVVGEGYANLGYLGVGIFGAVFAYIYGVMAQKWGRCPHFSAEKFLFCVFLTFIPQVYRDGFSSLVWFPFGYGAPLGVFALVHWLRSPVKLAATSSCAVRFSSFHGLKQTVPLVGKGC